MGPRSITENYSDLPEFASYWSSLSTPCHRITWSIHFIDPSALGRVVFALHRERILRHEVKSERLEYLRSLQMFPSSHSCQDCLEFYSQDEVLSLFVRQHEKVDSSES